MPRTVPRRAAMISASEQRTALYRFYDADVKLLYVGITNDPWRRWREHVREQPWYPQVKHQAVTWYESKFTAERAERAAIRCEHPQFNLAGADEPIPEELPARPTEMHAPPAAPVLAAPPADPEPEPEAEPEIAPQPEQVLAAGPGVEAAALPEPEVELALEPPGLPVLAQHSRRTVTIVLACIAWALLPSLPGMPKDWHSPWMIGLVVSTPIPVFVFFLIAFAPKIHRFGRWLDLNFSPPQGSPGK